MQKINAAVLTSFLFYKIIIDKTNLIQYSVFCQIIKNISLWN